jgi:hypothetical protein
VATESASRENLTARDHLCAIMQTLEESAAVTYVLDSQWRFVYCNPAWDSFAQSNGAPQLTAKALLGSDLFDAIPEVLRAAYRDAFRKVLSTREVWERSYECSSPKLFRTFRMRIHLIQEKNWFLVTNALVVERSHTNPAEADADRYVNGDGFITMCAHCRCSKRENAPNCWDFVPQHLQLKRGSAIQVSHGLCPVCLDYFYPPSQGAATP